MGNDLNFYTKGEEIANAITHGIGAILAIAAAALLVVFASLTGDAFKIVSYSIFGFSLIMMYLGSTLYHSISNKKAKTVFRVIDHSAIYILIAGTYTPFILVKLRDNVVAIIILIVLWVLTIVGIVFKSIWLNKFEKLSTIIYLLMGWAIIFIFGDVVKLIPRLCLVMLALGGLSYTFGCIFFIKDKWPYNHAIWHIFVLAGSILHFFAVILYL